ncbi:MAG TPA: PilZ domain-containing protein [Anaeromyxobacter sp.]|nr:PilZ domain-containing protein [Anaeromyxobacter sp.]
MAGLAEWLQRFRQLHEKARRGPLQGAELEAYRAGRDELARALLAAQRLALRPGETARRALRVARALQVDLDLVTSRERAVTIDLSTGGFACLLAKGPPVGEEVGFSLRLPASDLLVGRARVQDVKVLPGNARVSFAFVNQDEEEKERIEMFVFDTVLAHLQG